MAKMPTKSKTIKSTSKNKHFACISKSVVRLAYNGQTYNFFDRHLTGRTTCVGDPCEIRLHAVENMFALCATSGWKIAGCEVTLEKIPCDRCCCLLAAAQLGKINILTDIPDDKLHLWELLAIKVELDVECR